MLFLAGTAEASHYRYGTINYTVLGHPSPDSTTIEVTVTQAWRTSFFFFGTPAIGSTANGTTTLQINHANGSFIESRTVNLTITSVNPADDWFFGEYTTIFSIHSDSAYVLSYENCCRISGLANNSGENFRSETIVTPTRSNNESPKGTIVPIVKLGKGNPGASFNVAAADPNGDPLVFRLATRFEAEDDGGGSSVNAPGFLVSPTGVATFSTVGKTTGALYNAWVAIEDPFGSKVILDFLIEIVDSSAAPIFDYSVTPDPAVCIQAKPGDMVSFTVAAFDPDPTDVVTISAVGLPIGATTTPALPTPGGNPDSVSFSWMPGNGNIGATVISFTAEDQGGVSTSTSVCIIVSLKPIFAVPPTPAQAIPQVVVPGNNLSFTVEAFDPDPTDSVTINMVNGKNSGGTLIPLYAGASFTPFPTPWGNPTMGNFSWNTVGSDWGLQPVVFTAEDGFGQTTDHEVSVVVNTPPQFSSSPVVSGQVGNFYSYNVMATDPDTAFGDNLTLLAIGGLPSWATFTDLGGGKGVLSGTPGPGNGGNFSISLAAEDMFHHLNGTATQGFVINIIDTGNGVPPAGCNPLEVVSLTLVNASNGMDVKTLMDGDTIDKRILTSFSVRANTCGGIAPIECIDFENANMPAGTIPGIVFTNASSGPVLVNGANPNFPGVNAAMVFNSAAPTGGDFDLGTPHSDFGGPGIGAGGALGAMHENNTALGKMLIVSTDLDPTDPDDHTGGGDMEFDFTAIGPVTLHSLTIMDVENSEGAAVARFYDGGGSLLSAQSLPITGNNGVATMNLGMVTGVMKMEIELQGSAAIDNICLSRPQNSGSNAVESVLFDVNGSLLTRENLPPYAIKGGTKTVYNPWNPAAGSYFIEATPYSQNNGKGTQGIAGSVNVVVIDGTPIVDCNGDPGGSAFIDSCGACVGGNTGSVACSSNTCVQLEVISFKLIDAINGSIIRSLNDGDIIDKSAMPPFSIRANVCKDPVGSVLFDLNGSIVQKENLIPYDINGGSVAVPAPYNPPAGSYTLVATPYSNANGNGTVGIAETVNFTVIGGTPRIAGGNVNLTDRDAQREGELTKPGEAGASSLSLAGADLLPSVQLYPNPTEGWLTVEVRNVNGSTELILLDNAGRKLRNISLGEELADGMQLYRVDLSTLPKGMYLIQLNSDSGLMHQRVIRN